MLEQLFSPIYNVGFSLIPHCIVAKWARCHGEMVDFSILGACGCHQLLSIVNCHLVIKNFGNGG